MKENINRVMKVSVRNLVEFILRNGDLDNRFSGKRETDAMLAGSRLHRKIQGRMKGNYDAEVPLKIQVDYENFAVSVEGRADGIEKTYDRDGNITEVTIDEIKCMYKDVSKFQIADKLHEAQAMCYGYMYLLQNPMEKINIQITYVNIETEEIKRLEEEFYYTELEEWFSRLMEQYKKWVMYTIEHSDERMETARQAEFPFDYRPGQKKIAASVYKVILQKKDLFIQAPTGVGKTMSVVFPAVKAVGEDLADKIFYLTAKTITGQVAHDSFARLRERGLKFKCISITAKDKMCIMEESNCNPDYCERAKGHFDRVNDAVYDVIIHEEDITREVIMEYAEKYQVCPYEMNLDISNFVDAIICDYNYAFDPVVSLKRYFSNASAERFLFLVDESHNLVERAREMYSAAIKKEDILLVKKLVGQRDNRVSGALEKCNRTMLAYKRDCGEKEYIYLDEISGMVMAVERLYGHMEKFLDEFREFEGRDKVLEFYFAVIQFLNIYECTSLTDKDDNSYYEVCGQITTDGEFYLRLMCINPAANLKNCMEKAVSTIFFSATLLPVNYYKLLLSGNIDDYAIYIDSPFEKKNRLLFLANDVSSKYTRRNISEFRKMAYYIETIASAKKGNYMVFAPSYKMMNDIEREILGDYDILLQKQHMNEKEREEFLLEFEKEREKTLISFCVMGGIFSEGIDLSQDKLIGSIIIGTGLPQICMEKEVVKTYFEKIGMNGFDYAYLYPGINKVLQAAGRVIRTESDRGIIALLDERFRKQEYVSLFPKEWSDVEIINANNTKERVEEFWMNM